MKPPLDVINLGMECDDAGGTKVTVWCKCWSVEDIDDVIAWLNLAKVVVEKWEDIRTEKALAPESPPPRPEPSVPFLKS